MRSPVRRACGSRAFHIYRSLTTTSPPICRARYSG
jgi:hypothetical protein